MYPPVHVQHTPSVDVYTWSQPEPVFWKARAGRLPRPKRASRGFLPAAQVAPTGGHRVNPTTAFLAMFQRMTGTTPDKVRGQGLAAS